MTAFVTATGISEDRRAQICISNTPSTELLVNVLGQSTFDLAQHGYSIVFAVVFLEAVGLPLPAALALPSDAANELTSGAWIYDVRSHGYPDPKAIRIRGSRRFDPSALNQSQEAFPDGKPIYVYCTCVREATSVRVARELEKRGLRVAVIKGGLRAREKAGLPVEPVPAEELATLPLFG